MKKVPLWKRIREVSKEVETTRRALHVAHERYMSGEPVGRSVAKYSNRLKELESKRRELNRLMVQEEAFTWDS